MGLSHPGIPVRFGQDGGCSNGFEFAITTDNAGMGDSQKGFEPVPVDQEMLRGWSECVDRLVHGPNGRLQDIDLIDFFRGAHGYSPGDSFLLNDRSQGVPVGFTQLLGVIEQWMMPASRQDHRRCEYRTCQTAPSGFIASCFNEGF